MTTCRSSVTMVKSSCKRNYAVSLRRKAFFLKRGGYDYLTQLPKGEHEFIPGGGFAQDEDEAYEAMGNTNDTTYSKCIGAHLSAGSEGVPLEQDKTAEEWAKGRVKALWSGILGISMDLLPWVGRLPHAVSGRSEPPPTSVVKSEKEDGGERMHVGAAPGLSGKALAEMVLVREVEGGPGDWFPDIMSYREEVEEGGGGEFTRRVERIAHMKYGRDFSSFAERNAKVLGEFA
ncbi:hypothetical protein M405DRAFT_840449 [Rhizopogon salebrosus TDB-379]|nr:hypothetical protein M405DRAFT_840449 [Rhizopogon salebrosus TDB-379]